MSRTLITILLITGLNTNIKAQSQALQHYLTQIHFFLDQEGQWIAPNIGFRTEDSISTSYIGIDFAKGIHPNSIRLTTKKYLPYLSEWRITGEMLFSWDASKKQVLLHGTGADGSVVSGESTLITATEMHFTSYRSDAGGKRTEQKEIFRLQQGNLEIGSSFKQNNTWGKEHTIRFTRMEQPKGNLAFMTTRDGNFEVYSMDCKGENLKNLSCNKAIDYAFSFTPDKRLVFYTNRDGNDEIYIMDADGKKASNLTNHPSSDRIPCVSPDGKQIAFLSDREEKSGKIYVMDTDGKNLRRLTNNGYFEDGPTWSPDGRKIVFTRELKDLKDTSRNAVGNGEVFIMDTDGTNEKQLTNKPGYDGGPIISPDGKQIAFYGKSENGKYDIFIMDIEGNNLVNLTRDDTEDYSPSWSPDGKWIACTRGSSKNYDVWLIHLETGIKTRLTTQPKRDESPFWIPE